ncbi:hypothetical protein GSY69_10910 [Brevibacterium sp. 5221]|uniref:Antitoxin VbhA domain-containing protein n=1 Tax=Brevibacterium rongguiense TaxID=2695267 RepID=A0A6N9H8V7_9MICO|nr:hypothetical protein [Brevibacterium rongguiense]MYM20459.1 hypothetical protein [Brevibacterium rongguiense]
MTEQPTTQTRPAVSTEEAMAFADGALGAAGHQVTDPYINQLRRQRLEGEISMDEYQCLAVAHIDAK